ncbi:MAG: hypothetical protein ACREBP_04045, partial [Sphingomicrobium sp.]
MSDSRAAVAIDRLPWLEDEPKSVKKSDLAGLWRWSVPALVLIAGLSYWLGLFTAPRDDYDAPIAERAAEPPSVSTMTLPEPKLPVAEAPIVAVPPAAQEAPPPTVRQGRPVTRRAVPVKPKAAPAKPVAPGTSTKLQYWPARNSASAAGRMVRIGT